MFHGRYVKPVCVPDTEPMTLTEALARDMFEHEATEFDAAPGATDEAWATDEDLRAFWTTRSKRVIAFMAEWRVQTRLAALPVD